MTLPLSTGIYDPGINGYRVPNTGTWANLTTWDSWTNWVNLPAGYVLTSSTIEDLGSARWFNIRTDTTAVGNIAYRVFASNTGEFAGEETITTIEPGTGNLSAFYGRYYAVEANVRSTGATPTVENMTVTATTYSLTLQQPDLATANLTAAGNSRVIPLDRVVSAVVAVQITAHDPPAAATTTNSTDYYLDTPVSNHVVPYITSKSRTGPTFILRNLVLGTAANMSSNSYTVDATVTVLPEQIHDGQNLATR